jgi:hypothetical protein
MVEKNARERSLGWCRTTLTGPRTSAGLLLPSSRPSWAECLCVLCRSSQRSCSATTPPTSSPGTNEVNSFFAHSQDGVSWSDSIQVSSVGHQSQYEMFGNRDIPFHGDYNWISLANTDPNDPESPLLAYMSWTDNRDVVPGTDPRELEEQNGFDDGFDVLQCRVDLVENTQSRDDGPLARRDAPYTGDNCGNGGGLDQNIYGSSLLLP